MSHLSLYDWSVCIVYLALVCGVALVCTRGQRDNEDYFIGGRGMNWFAVGVSMFATSFSSISFLGLPQRGAYQDFSFYLTILLIPVIITPLLWFIFVPMYLRLQVRSGYDYLRRRFGRSVQLVGSLLYCGYAVGWMGVMLHAIALTLKGLMDLDGAQYVTVLIGLGLFATAYTAVGGLRAVIWTDVLQAVTLGGAIIVVLLLALKGISGGWGGLWQIGAEHGRWAFFHVKSPPWAIENFTAKNSAYTSLAYAVFMYLPGYAVAQNMVQRYVCTGTIGRARGVVLLSAGINATLGFLFMLVGVALFVYYSQAGGMGMPQLESQDQILPHFAAAQAGGYGLVGLMLAGLFAAAMSTVDSGINGVASVVVYDWLGSRPLSLTASRLLTLSLGLLVILAALVAPLLGKTVIDIIMAIAGTLLGGLMAVFLLGMFSRRCNAPGVLIGLAAGGMTLLATALTSEVPAWWYGAFTVFPTLIISPWASRFFAAPSEASLTGMLWDGARS